jgi:hypothetical protein
MVLTRNHWRNFSGIRAASQGVGFVSVSNEDTSRSLTRPNERHKMRPMLRH